MNMGNAQQTKRLGEPGGAGSDLFQHALREDSNLETDWLWLAQQDLGVQERLYSVRRALYINPHSNVAQGALAQLTLARTSQSYGANSSHAELPCL